MSLSILGNIVTMDKSMVSFHTPGTKKKSKQLMQKGQPGPIKAPSIRDQTNGFCFLQQQGRCIHKLFAQGHNCQCNLHFMIPHYVPASFQENKTRNAFQLLGFPMGQWIIPHWCCGARVYSQEIHPTDWPTSLFSWSGSLRLYLVSYDQDGPVWHFKCPGQLKENLGWVLRTITKDNLSKVEHC